MLQYLVKISF